MYKNCSTSVTFAKILSKANKILDQNIESLDSLNFLELQKSPKSKLLKLKWSAINDLKSDNNIEIKEAVKAGSMVILSKTHLYEHNVFMTHWWNDI